MFMAVFSCLMLESRVSFSSASIPEIRQKCDHFYLINDKTMQIFGQQVLPALTC
jgi:hypothetical protein